MALRSDITNGHIHKWYIVLDNQNRKDRRTPSRETWLQGKHWASFSEEEENHVTTYTCNHSRKTMLHECNFLVCFLVCYFHDDMPLQRPTKMGLSLLPTIAVFGSYTACMHFSGRNKHWRWHVRSHEYVCRQVARDAVCWEVINLFANSDQHMLTPLVEEYFHLCSLVSQRRLNLSPQRSPTKTNMHGVDLYIATTLNSNFCYSFQQ